MRKLFITNAIVGLSVNELECLQTEIEQMSICELRRRYKNAKIITEEKGERLDFSCFAVTFKYTFKYP